jgi:hypothetical protein
MRDSAPTSLMTAQCARGSRFRELRNLRLRRPTEQVFRLPSQVDASRSLTSAIRSFVHATVTYPLKLLVRPVALSGRHHSSQPTEKLDVDPEAPSATAQLALTWSPQDAPRHAKSLALIHRLAGRLHRRR